MKFIRHLLEQPFITATGAAALVHSTWSLGTFFAGEQPEGWHIIGWLVPALLIAFALDVGQIGTSIQIRERGLNITRGITFFVFAIATYYLQFLYAAHHLPDIALSAGVPEAHEESVRWLVGLAIWAIPALLPLSTLLYTFSSDESQEVESSRDETVTIEPTWMNEAEVELIEQQLLPVSELPALEPGQNYEYDVINEEAAQLFVETCEHCGWESDAKDNLGNARRALWAHHRHHCEKVPADADA